MELIKFAVIFFSASLCGFFFAGALAKKQVDDLKERSFLFKVAKVDFELGMIETKGGLILVQGNPLNKKEAARDVFSKSPLYAGAEIEYNPKKGEVEVFSFTGLPVTLRDFTLFSPRNKDSK